MDRKAYYESLLTNRRQQLLERCGRSRPRRASPTCERFAEGAGSRIDRLAQQLFLERMEREDAIELEQIADALSRLERGEFGLCSACGARVLEGRLQLLPHTAVCSDCATSQTLVTAEQNSPRRDASRPH